MIRLSRRQSPPSIVSRSNVCHFLIKVSVKQVIIYYLLTTDRSTVSRWALREPGGDSGEGAHRKGGQHWLAERVVMRPRQHSVAEQCNRKASSCNRPHTKPGPVPPFPLSKWPVDPNQQQHSPQGPNKQASYSPIHYYMVMKGSSVYTAH